LPRTCPKSMIIRNKNGQIVIRNCDRQVLEGSGRCVFHDTYAWRTHAELMRQKIKEKIEKGDLNFQGYHFPEMDFSTISKGFKAPVNFYGTVFHENVFSIYLVR